MYSIYFEKRILQVLHQNCDSLTNPNAVVFHYSNLETLKTLPGLFEESKNIKHLIVTNSPDNTAEDAAQAFKTICNCFTRINAAGGLVQNERGEYLLIFRNGLWDLPKGKQEEGEEIALCAQREVMEECGINDLQMGDLICITHHTYHLKGDFILKHTYWYNMKCNASQVNLTPQLEEGIQKCEWVSPDKLPQYLNNTYPSIRKVFESVK